jgi:hypothetical protein
VAALATLAAAVTGTGFAAASPKAAPLVIAKSTAGSTTTFDHSALDKLLAAYVVKGKDGINRVDYMRFKADGLASLKSYLDALQAADPTKLGPDEHAAFFINLYNAATLRVALERYPLKSIKEARLADAKGELHDGPWQANLVKINGLDLTLDQISNAVLRPTLMTRDPRGHYLLNCLSIGCPNLLPAAITGSKLEAQLTEAARDFVVHPRGLAIKDGKATGSSLYAWYGEDFGGQPGLIAHLKKAGGADVATRLADIKEIGDHGYDWALADAAVK